MGKLHTGVLMTHAFPHGGSELMMPVSHRGQKVVVFSNKWLLVVFQTQMVC